MENKIENKTRELESVVVPPNSGMSKFGLFALGLATGIARVAILAEIFDENIPTVRPSNANTNSQSAIKSVETKAIQIK